MESIILLLIYICVVVAVAWLVLWVLGQLGLELPPMVVKIFWVVVILIVILLLWRMIGPTISGGSLPGIR